MEEKKKSFLYLCLFFTLYGENYCNVLAMSLQTNCHLLEADSLFQMFPVFPIIKMTDVLLISVQSCSLLVPPGLQLCHHVTAKVTLCLG